VIVYIVEHLGRGIPPNSKCVLPLINRIREQLLRDLVLLRMDPSGGLVQRGRNANPVERLQDRAAQLRSRLEQRDRMLAIQRERLLELRRQQQELWLQKTREQFEHLLRELAQRKQFLDQLARNLWGVSPETLAEEFRDNDPIVRWVAVQVAGARKYHLEGELIELLSDPQPEVREAAHQALVRVARGTDFGPAPTATATERAQALRTWRTWLSLQDPSAPVQSLPPEDLANEEASRLSKGLVRASPGEQEELLRHLKESKGGVYTEALAQAIPELTPSLQAKARDALAERLTRMNAETLRDKLQDEKREVRRAAALACAMKESRDHVPDLIALLEDAEPLVRQAAHAALRSLSGQDHGPARDASSAERARAIAAWRQWWQKQNNR
jgi:hypothetical protein